MTYNNTVQYILNEDSLGVLRQLEDNAIDLILTDPPYFNVLSTGYHGEDAGWDTQWKNEQAFMDWMELYVIELKRVLKPNGHLFIFTSTWQNNNVYNVLQKHSLDVLNNIIWFKDSTAKATGMAAKSSLPALRKYLTQREHLLYAGNYGKYKEDASIKSIDHQMDLFKRHALAPLINHFAEAARVNGKTTADLNKLMGNRMAGHHFTQSQFSIPSVKNYKVLAAVLPELMLDYKTGKAFDSVEEAQRFYRDEYHAILVQARLVNGVDKSLYRTFNATKDIFYSDVWTYEIPRVKDRHVCEKPLDMMLDIIKTTTSEGQYVLDAFAGSGVVGEACARLNRNFIGIEQQAKWADKGNLRIRSVPNVI